MAELAYTGILFLPQPICNPIGESRLFAERIYPHMRKWVHSISMQTLKGVGDESPGIACIQGSVGRWVPALSDEERTPGGHLVNPIAHSRDSSVDYGVMHIEEGKVNLHPMNNLVDVFPDVVVRRLPPRSKRLTRTSILTGLKDSPSIFVLMR